MLALYVLAIFEAVAVIVAHTPLHHVSRTELIKISLLRAAGHAILGVACEFEFRAARALAVGSGRLSWRARALLRAAAALLLAYLDDDSTALAVLPADVATKWPLRAVEPLSALAAACLIASLVAGPPALRTCVLDARGGGPPFQSASLLGMVFFACHNKDIWRYYRIDKKALAGSRGGEPLDVPDLPPQPPGAQTVDVRAEFGQLRGATLLRDLLWVSREQLGYQLGWSAYTTLMAYAPALGMKLLIDYVAHYDGGGLTPDAVLYAALLVVGTVTKNVGTSHTFYCGWDYGTRMRAFCSRAICEKVLRLDIGAAGLSIGQITNMLAVDANYLLQFSPLSVWVVMELVQLILTLSLLFWLLGTCAIGGVLVTLLTVPINVYTIRWTKRLQEKLMRERDDRMRLVSEAMQAIRAIKLHAWEGTFEAAISARRRRELSTLLRFQLISAINSTTVLSTPTLAATACFLTQWFILRKPFPASAGFTSLTLFQLLSTSLAFWPMCVNSAIQANVGLQRLRRFLALPEVDGVPNTHNPKNEDNVAAGTTAPLEAEARPGALCIRDGVFRWPTGPGAAGRSAGAAPAAASTAAPAVPADDDAPRLPTLQAINLSITPGQLVVVAGPTGCGKSSLLSALVGEIRRSEGHVAVHGSLSYVPQRATIFNQSLRDNILFGLPLEPARYEAVLDACALKPDLALLEEADETEIGERGVNLSGGQQQRVNLARACYARSDVILLDDPLSAVDAHVGQHIFEQCICGLLADRTRILVTHATALAIPSAHTVVAMGAGGRILASGPPDDAHEAIVSLRAQGQTPTSTPGSTPMPTPSPPSRRGVPSSAATRDDAARPNRAGRDGNGPAANGDAGGISPRANGRRGGAAAPLIKPRTAPGRAGNRRGSITQREERARGTAKTGQYVTYLRAAGGWLFGTAFLGALTAYATGAPLQSYTLQLWIDAMETSPVGSAAANMRCYWYAAAAGWLLVSAVMRNMLMPLGQLRAARVMHASMARHVLRANISWFQASPLGRILNRFSSDIASIDQQVMSTFRDALARSLEVVAIALMCTLGTGHRGSQAVVLASIGATCGLVWALTSVYRVGMRELRRLESLTKSPFLAYFAELTSGVSVIRAFGAEQRFLRGADALCDDANRVTLYLWCTNQWLRTWMSLVSSGVTLSCVAAVLWQAHALSGGAAGLTLSYATQFTGCVSFLFRAWTQLEVSMNYVERVDEYSRILPQENYDDDGEPPPASWPANGSIAFENVMLQYASAASPVFRRLSFEVEGRTRMGIVGRTGAGKSSLMVALFREVELSGGRILIDGIDTRGVPLQLLRSRLAIIQQEPTLFCGTLRYNLAPHEGEGDDVNAAPGGARQAADVRLWRALERTGMDARVRSMGGLDAAVSEGGGNLSAGERQLLCMSRALLREAAVLVMDEATASVDHVTDERLQAMVRADLRGTCTVLTIAHRLRTVCFYDRIVVLGQGEVLESGTPLKLLTEAGGQLHRLALETGDYEALVSIARDAANDVAGTTADAAQ